MRDALLNAALYILSGILCLKLVAYGIALGQMMRRGMSVLPADAQSLGLAGHFPADLNPIDAAFARLRSRALHVLARAVFNGPVLITLGFAACATASDGTNTLALRCVGLTSAALSIFACVAAVLRRLIMGRNDWRTSDVALPAWGPLSRWAVVSDTSDPGANRLVYFFVLLYMSLLGFAALYQALDVTNGRVFDVDGARGWTTWLYFSATTLATVGYGDIHAHSAGAQIAVTCQIMSGPLLIAWLVAVMLAPIGPSDIQGDTTASDVHEADLPEPDDGAPSVADEAHEQKGDRRAR